MTYFDFFSNIEYKFPNGITENVKNIFRRPVINTTQENTIELSDNQSPDQLSILLYEDPSFFYINLLNNDVVSDNYWPVSGEEYTELLESEYAGYAFHILEEPELKPTRGDIFVLKSDFDGYTPDNSDLEDITLTYGIVENWDPNYRKMWIKNYSIGNTGSQTEDELFKEDNRFYLFKRNVDGSYGNDGSKINASNISGDNNAFALDPNYPGNSGDEFTMKRINLYSDSVNHFTLSSDIQINPYTKNIFDSGLAPSYTITDFAGTTYNSGNTNGVCSVLEGYILSANGQTGTDNMPYNTSASVSTIEEIYQNQNDVKRKVRVLPQTIIGNIVENIKREFDG